MAVEHLVTLQETFAGFDDEHKSGENYYKIINVDIESFSLDFSGFSDDKNLQSIPAPIQDIDENWENLSSDNINIDSISLHQENLEESFSASDDKNVTTGGTIERDLSEIFYSTDEVKGESLDIPKIISATPDGDSFAFYQTFNVQATGVQQPRATIELYDNSSPKKLIKAWHSILMERDTSASNTWKVSYTMDIYLDDFLFPGTYNVKFKVYNDYGYKDEVWKQFRILEDDVQIKLAEIEKNYDKNSIVFVLNIKNQNAYWVNLYPLLVSEYINKELVITKIEGSQNVILKDNFLFFKSSGEWDTIRVYTKYNQSEILLERAGHLNKKDLKVGYKVEVDDIISGKHYDLSRYVKSISHQRDTDLEAAQATIVFTTTNGLSPFSNQDTPLFYGNKVTISAYLDKGNSSEFIKDFIGYISSVDTSSSEIKVTAFDKLQNFNRRLSEDLYYSPTKVELYENLKSSDGVKFEGSHSGWAQLPSPEIYVKGKKLKAGEYFIDYYRGVVYLQKNPYLYPEWIERNIEVNNVSDRQNFQLDFELNLSSTVTVKHFYEEKVEYTCVDGVGAQYVWVERGVLLNKSDYTIDYQRNIVKLTNPIPEDTSTVKNHRLYIACRKDIGEVKAKYSYFEPKTNEVEDIIMDLAKKVGFVQSELEDSYTEHIYTRDGFNFQLSYKNIKKINWIKRNGTIFGGDYKVFEKDGILQLDGLYPSTEIMIDPILSTSRFQTNGYNLELSTDTYLPGDVNRSVTAVLPDGGWILKKYHWEGVHLDFTNFARVALALKVSVGQTITIEFLDDTDFTVLKSFTFTLPANQWTVCEMNVADLEDNVGDMKIRASDCKIWIDYLHIPSNTIEVSYDYNTIESTGITINEVWFQREEVETFKDVLDDILKQVEPSYSMWIDNREKLRTGYRKIPFYYILPAVYNHKGLNSDVVFGRFLLPDYSLNISKSFSHSISEEQVYTAVQVVGKLSEKANVCLRASAEDKCSIVNGVSYGKSSQEIKRDKLTQYNLPSSDLIVKLIQQQSNPPQAGNASVVVDGNISSGMSWYIRKENDATPPFSNEQEMILITLPEDTEWEEIDICVGSYQNKIIREEMYIEVEASDGSRWFPEGEWQQKKQGQTGTWLKWKNTRFKYKKIKKICIYCSEAWRWVTSESIQGGGKK